MNSKPIFNIGDTVWIATCGQRQIDIPCEICYGKKQVKLILGNDEECILPCEYCGKGYNCQTGYTISYEWKAEPVQTMIKGVSLDNNGQYDYSCETYCSDSKNIFLTKEMALVRCDEMATENAINEQKSLECRKFNDKRNYSWNAGYHRSEAKRAQQQLEYHTKKAVFMAARSKTDLNKV